MPAVRKLTVEEVRSIENKGKSQRRQIEEQYDNILAEFSPGEGAEIELDAGETKPAIRHRLNAAAMRRGFDLKWIRAGSNTLKFRVLGAPVAAPEEEETEQEEEESNGTAAALAEFEMPESEPEPEPEPVSTDKKPVRKAPVKKQVTARQPYVEAP